MLSSKRSMTLKKQKVVVESFSAGYLSFVSTVQKLKGKKNPAICRTSFGFITAYQNKQSAMLLL